MTLRTICRITDVELFHLTPESVEDIYNLNLFFKNHLDYQDCIKKIASRFNIESQGEVILLNIPVYKISILNLTRGEGDTTHGFFSYHYDANYIRVYWNNNNKEVIFQGKQ